MSSSKVPLSTFFITITVLIFTKHNNHQATLSPFPFIFVFYGSKCISSLTQHTLKYHLNSAKIHNTMLGQVTLGNNNKILLYFLNLELCERAYNKTIV